MKKIPMKLRLASAVGTLGGGIGSVIGMWLASDSYGLPIGFFIGFTIGFVGGYNLGVMIKIEENIALSDRFAPRVDILAIVLALILVVAGFVGLVFRGWDVRMFLSTLFFLLCAVYLGYKRAKS